MFQISRNTFLKTLTFYNELHNVQIKVEDNSFLKEHLHLIFQLNFNGFLCWSKKFKSSHYMADP